MAFGIRIAILGAGSRGRGFGAILRDFCPEAAICAVAESREDYRLDFAREHGLGPGQVFKSWQDYAASGARPGAVIVATPDRELVEPAVTFLERGCHLFLEKPMATSLPDCRRIVQAQRQSGVITATFTMTAFTQQGGRKIRVPGTEAELLFDEARLVLRRFGDENVECLEFGPEPGGHGGGDRRALMAWLRAIRENNPAHVLTDVHESLRTHAIVFEAEESRRTGKSVEVGSYCASVGQ